MKEGRKPGGQYINVTDDAVHSIRVKRVYSSNVAECSETLIMTRDAFTKCYREWIQPKRMGWKNRVRRRR